MSTGAIILVIIGFSMPIGMIGFFVWRSNRRIHQLEERFKGPFR
jgi:hypothetical protein